MAFFKRWNDHDSVTIKYSTNIFSCYRGHLNVQVSINFSQIQVRYVFGLPTQATSG